MSSGVIFGESVVGSKVIRNIRKVFRSASGVLFGRSTGGTGRGEEIAFASIPALIGVYTTSQVDAIIGGIAGLTSDDIDTLAEINAILTDADLASVSYVDSGLSGKQATLVSGTNIKTVNSTSLLGSGDIAVSAAPGGSSGQVQYNNAGAFGGMTAVVYAGTGTHVTITSQAAATIPLCIKGAASQSGNLTEWRNSSNTLLLRVKSGGYLEAGQGNQFDATFQNSNWGQSTGIVFNSTYAISFARNNSYIAHFNADNYRFELLYGIRVVSPTAPSSASDTGTAGEIRWDANYIYVCTATNTWKRVAIATW